MSVERTTIRLEPEALGGITLPAFEANGKDGPKLTLIAGVHGGEYSSIAAVIRFMRGLDTNELTGSITAVPVVSMTSFQERSPFVVPQDGKNLNRQFPGDPGGSYSQILAHALFEKLIRPADYVIDLHGGDMTEALEPFAIYEQSPVQDTARDLAVAIGLPYVICTEREEGPVGGTTTKAAADAGIPAVISEIGGRGILEEDAVAWHVEGVTNGLRHLGMLPGDPTPPRRPISTVGQFIWMRSEREGWWQPEHEVGAAVDAGQRIGVVTDLYGDVLEEIVAPQAGVLLFVTSSPAMPANGLLLGLGADVARL
jgi:uncharacterized protein